jgi:hypothetical protein
MSNSEIVQELINLTIHDLKIIGKDGQVYQIFPDASKLSYVSLELLEGMFEASVVGKLVIRDLNSTAEQINFSGFEDVVIKIENPDIPNSYKSLRYKIYNVKATEDQIKNNKLNQDVNISSVKLEIQFISYEHYLLSYKEFSELTGSTGADIITKIASKDGEDNLGLVNVINNNFFKSGNKQQGTTQKPMFIEPTYNWVWYKQNQSLYPWGKLNRPVKATQLLQFLAEHSVAESNQYACNYMFWQDIDRWNFRSVESLLKEKTDKKYVASTVSTKTGNIRQLQIINESNYLRLLESNAFSAKYYLVEPKWDHPYREILDYNESHSVKEISFDYFKDYNKWLKVEKYPLLETGVDTKPTVANVINDNISGYFSPSYSNRDKTVEWDHYGYTFSNRDGFETWQPMFDQTELDGKICQIIQKEIKQKIKDKKIEYANKKNLKEKWKLYRCSICCDTRYRDPTEQLENEPVFTPEYGVVAAGSFSDMVNFDIADGSTLGRQFPMGLTLSYELDSDPYNKTIGDLFHLVDTPTLQTKYLYDLEEKRVDIARDLLQASITRIQNIKQMMIERWNRLVSECSINPDCDFFESYGEGSISEARYNRHLRDCDRAIANRQQILNSNYFSKLKNIISEEKQNFLEVYEKFKDRKAFFISKEIGFTADNSKLNLFNIKTIKRVPIRGSKYEKLAKKSVVDNWIAALSEEQLQSNDFAFKGFPVGATSYYPYEIYYDNDSSIDPSIKHPHYDSQYNLNIGYNANPSFSLFEDFGGPDSGGPLDRNPYSVFTYYAQYLFKMTVDIKRSYPVAGSPTCDSRQDSFTETYEYYRIATGTDPSELTPDNIIKRTIQNLEVQKWDDIRTLTYSESGFADYFYDFYYYSVYNDDLSITNKTNNSISFRRRYDVTSSCNNHFSDYTFTIEFVEAASNNKGNPYLSQFNSAICVAAPYGLERITDFNPIDYLNSRNFVNIEGNEEPVRPTENILEEIESFVRIEFQTPIGVNTLYDFPQGFYDTPGSEYYLPYNVLITPGPFGTKSVDYNISVIGQDPFGFDVAVKRIKKKKQNLNTGKKALTNHKDNHIIETGYSHFPQSYYERPANETYEATYGYLPSIATTYNGLYTIGVRGYDNYFRRPLNRFNSASKIYNSNDNFPLYEKRFYPPQEVLDQKSRTYGYSIGDVFSSDSDNKRLVQDDFSNFYMRSSNNINTTTTEILYYDMIQRTTRKNPLSLAQSYYEFSNIRPRSISARTALPSSYYNLSTPYYEGGSWNTKIPKARYRTTRYEVAAGNYTQVYVDAEVSSWTSLNAVDAFKDFNDTDFMNAIPVLSNTTAIRIHANEPVPIDVNYFKSTTPLPPSTSDRITSSWTILGENYLKNRNERVEPEDETSFYGYYYGSSIWKHELADNLEKLVWKNDYTGETEYGLVSPELEEEFSVFDRNFAAQFVVMTRQTIDIEGPCGDYNCSNPNPVNNAPCPDDNPLCNCPCQELRPDRLLVGVTGSEPTYKELKDLEKEIKECTLIEEKLGEDWLGCAWNDPKNPLNCNCPCIGERYMDYLRYSQTYCTFWQTPPERPLLRNAQMMQLLSNKILVKLNGDLTLRPGNVVTLDLGDKRYSGKWLVSSILHDFAKTKHLMDVILIRDTEYKDPNKKAKKLTLNTE